MQIKGEWGARRGDSVPRLVQSMSVGAQWDPSARKKKKRKKKKKKNKKKKKKGTLTGVKPALLMEHQRINNTKCVLCPWQSIVFHNGSIRLK